MTEHVAILLGVWIFAVATVISKEVQGGFMLVAFAVAIAVSIYLN